MQQRASAEHQRRHHRQFGLGQLLRKGVFLDDRQRHTLELQALVAALSQQQAAAEARIATLSRYRAQLQEKVHSLEDRLQHHHHRHHPAPPSPSASPAQHPHTHASSAHSHGETHLGRWQTRLATRAQQPASHPGASPAVTQAAAAGADNTTHSASSDHRDRHPASDDAPWEEGEEVAMLRRTIDELMSRAETQQQQQRGVGPVPGTETGGATGVDPVPGASPSAMAAAGHDEAVSVEEGSLWDALSALVTARAEARPSGGDQGTGVSGCEGGGDVGGGGGGGLDRVQGGRQVWAQPRHRARLLAATVEALKLLQEQQRKMVRVLRKLSREGPRGVVGQLEGLRQENTGLSIRYNAAQLAHQQCQRALGVLVDENRGMAALVKQLQASAPARQHIHAFASPDPVRRCLSELSDV
ncbi:MAG: hypothetical protein WDW38_003093 [Sanguina aurantia]